MDTRYWGGSAWQLFHLIAEGSPAARKTLVLMNKVLPCKFCRASTTEFVGANPLTKSKKPGRWLYEIHNTVNHKLTEQAKTDSTVILPDPDPTYEEIHKRYADILAKPPHAVPGRDFLFSVAYNYPEKPEAEDIATHERFLKELQKTYPFAELRKVFAMYTEMYPIDVSSRNAYLHWMYGLLKDLAAKTKSPIRSFKGYTHHVAYYKSGCTKRTYHGKTCRRLDNGNYTKRRDHKRTRRIVAGSLLS